MSEGVLTGASPGVLDVRWVSSFLRRVRRIQGITPEEGDVARNADALSQGFTRLKEALGTLKDQSDDTSPQESDVKVAFLAYADGFEANWGGAAVSEDVLRFCREERLMPYVPKVIRLARECFPSAIGIGLDIEYDPDSGERWVSVEFLVTDAVTEILDQGDEYARRFGEMVPWPDRAKIRLCYYAS